jgi:ATP-dependent DNA helicase RecG
LLSNSNAENDQRRSLREIITREMIANVLIHREFTSSYPIRGNIVKKEKA